jgi:hypothetical protein
MSAPHGEAQWVIHSLWTGPVQFQAAYPLFFMLA